MTSEEVKQAKEIISSYLDMELLRFTTAGSVDDGKSTLIGRLLYDSKSIFQDQLESIEKTSLRRGDEHVNLALLTDGLRAEREQGITIDVAYRYFHTPKRKFIIADTPGHIQYTRNMVTGASTANLAVILIDARNGVLEQTLRHSYIASLLEIPHIVVCVNKMDLVDYSEKTFEKIKKDYESVKEKLGIKDLHFIPISALKGDNVVNKSENMPWYKGETLLHLLENIDLKEDYNLKNARFPVQYVIRPQSDKFHDYRGYAGRLVSGKIRQGDNVTILPSGLTTKIKTIDYYKEQLEEAFAPQSVTLTLEDDIDISRGDMIVKTDDKPTESKEIEMKICWFNPRPMINNGKYIIRHTTNEVKCMIKEVEYKIDINTLEKNFEDKEIKMNDIAKIKIKTGKALFFDKYKENRQTGSVIFIDEHTNETVAAGMIE
jgi:sulfate adenylyltransferase subunit 1